LARFSASLSALLRSCKYTPDPGSTPQSTLPRARPHAPRPNAGD
jgi:hypothetical protein